jgi:hypothetical protein
VRCQWIAKCIRKAQLRGGRALNFASTVGRDLQRPNASVQWFLIDCAGMRFDCRAALAFSPAGLRGGRSAQLGGCTAVRERITGRHLEGARRPMRPLVHPPVGRRVWPWILCAGSRADEDPAAARRRRPGADPGVGSDVDGSRQPCHQSVDCLMMLTRSRVPLDDRRVSAWNQRPAPTPPTVAA